MTKCEEFHKLAGDGPKGAKGVFTLYLDGVRYGLVTDPCLDGEYFIDDDGLVVIRTGKMQLRQQKVAGFELID